MDAESSHDLKEFLLTRLQDLRDAVLWKIDGVDEYDLRRPLTPTGTNLLGLVKHLADVEFGYFGATFGRPTEIPMPWLDDDAPPDSDMWATADESVDDIVSLYRGAWDHARITVENAELTSPGVVEWWSADRQEVTLGEILVHVTAETARHAGHLDILRESIDGVAGLSASNDTMTHTASTALRDHLARVQAAADSVRGT